MEEIPLSAPAYRGPHIIPIHCFQNLQAFQFSRSLSIANCFLEFSLNCAGRKKNKKTIGNKNVELKQFAIGVQPLPHSRNMDLCIGASAHCNVWNRFLNQTSADPKIGSFSFWASPVEIPSGSTTVPFCVSVNHNICTLEHLEPQAKHLQVRKLRVSPFGQVQSRSQVFSWVGLCLILCLWIRTSEHWNRHLQIWKLYMWAPPFGTSS